MCSLYDSYHEALTEAIRRKEYSMEIFSEHVYQECAAKTKCPPCGSRSKCGCHTICPCKSDSTGDSCRKTTGKQAVKVVVHVKQRRRWTVQNASSFACISFGKMHAKRRRTDRKEINMEIFLNTMLQTEKADFQHIQKEHEPNASVSRCGGCVVKRIGCIIHWGKGKQNTNIFLRTGLQGNWIAFFLILMRFFLRPQNACGCSFCRFPLE